MNLSRISRRFQSLVYLLRLGLSRYKYMSEEYTILMWRRSIERLCELDRNPLPVGFETPEVPREMVAELESMLAIVDAMTPEEISDATLLADESRRQRIADDVCVDVQLVAATLAQYNEMAKIITNAGRQTDRGYVQLSARRKRQM